MIYKILLYISLITISFSQLHAKDSIEFHYDGIYLDGVTLEQLETLYQDYRYKDYIYMPDWQYPPIYLQSIPIDFNTIKDTKKRNKLFLQMIIPLALKINQELILERYELEQLIQDFNNNHNLSEQQINTIEDKAAKYNIFTRLQGERRYALILRHLKDKIDIIPPSILIAAAAIESNWGTNRPIRLANSLYRELIWHTTDGLEPLDEKEDNSYRYKIFPNLYSSMYSYALKINSGVNYEQFRTARSQIRSKDIPILGRNIAHTMYFDSALKNFAGLLDYTITFYELTNIDEAQLAPLDLPKERN